MKRRAFFRRLLGSLGVAVSSSAPGAGKARSVLIQESPVAGFQFHSGDAIWSSLSVGNPLMLEREPGNQHDPDAVAVYSGEHKLGYVPRGENRAIAKMLDRGECLEASISQLLVDDDPWQRVRIDIVLE